MSEPRRETQKPPNETEMTWREISRACDFLGLTIYGIPIKDRFEQLHDGYRRTIIEMARWFIAARAEERERCAKIVIDELPQRGLIVDKIRSG